ncbi:hypothetical protein WJX72_004973 [[Myrmecia] bisecta]|uniref:Uncharacterized protein n=1 Tax=[Myrmecia] bisecta TaxID=41462 RepID=A0AAW1PH81_9CHLO
MNDLTNQRQSEGAHNLEHREVGDRMRSGAKKLFGGFRSKKHGTGLSEDETSPRGMQAPGVHDTLAQTGNTLTSSTQSGITGRAAHMDEDAGNVKVSAPIGGGVAAPATVQQLQPLLPKSEEPPSGTHHERGGTVIQDLKTKADRYGPELQNAAPTGAAPPGRGTGHGSEIAYEEASSKRDTNLPGARAPQAAGYAPLSEDAPTTPPPTPIEYEEDVSAAKQNRGPSHQLPTVPPQPTRISYETSEKMAAGGPHGASSQDNKVVSDAQAATGSIKQDKQHDEAAKLAAEAGEKLHHGVGHVAAAVEQVDHHVSSPTGQRDVAHAGTKVTSEGHEGGVAFTVGSTEAAHDKPQGLDAVKPDVTDRSPATEDVTAQAQGVAAAASEKAKDALAFASDAATGAYETVKSYVAGPAQPNPVADAKVVKRAGVINPTPDNPYIEALSPIIITDASGTGTTAAGQQTADQLQRAGDTAGLQPGTGVNLSGTTAAAQQKAAAAKDVAVSKAAAAKDVAASKAAEAGNIAATKLAAAREVAGVKYQETVEAVMPHVEHAKQVAGAYVGEIQGAAAEKLESVQHVASEYAQELQTTAREAVVAGQERTKEVVAQAVSTVQNASLDDVEHSSFVRAAVGVFLLWLACGLSWAWSFGLLVMTVVVTLLMRMAERRRAHRRSLFSAHRGQPPVSAPITGTGLDRTPQATAPHINSPSAIRDSVLPSGQQAVTILLPPGVQYTEVARPEQ